MRRLLLSSAAAGVFFAAAGASAQTVNYGSLEEVFGEPVTTSASGTPMRSTETPANITIVTADEIRQSGSRSIPEILSMVAGLDVLQTSITTYDIGVRGYQQPQQPRLLVLLDGRQVFIDDYSRTVWDNIPVNIDDIRQIEVVKGAASALFGSNAASGVINIVTYSPIYDDNNTAAVRVGTQNSYTGDATFTLKGDNYGVKTSIGGLKSSAFGTSYYPLDSSPWKPLQDFISNSAVFQASPTLQLSSEFTWSRTKTYTGDPTDFSIIGDEGVTTYSARLGADWNSHYGVISANAYFNHSDISLSEPEDDGIPYGTKISLLVAQLQDRFQIGTENTVRVGLEYRFRDYKQNSFNVIPQSPDLQQNIFSASGTWVWQVMPRLTWTNAARFDQQDSQQVGILPPNSFVTYNDYNAAQHAVSANSDLVFAATDVDSFRGGFGRGVQMPSMIQSGYSQIWTYGANTPAAFPNDADANPRLKPTITQDYSLDYNRTIAALLSSAKVSVYYETVHDITAPFQVTPYTETEGGVVWPVVRAENVGNSKGWGGEAELRGKSETGLRWDFSYSYSRVSDSAAVLETVNYQGSAPHSTVRAMLGYSAGPWEFDVKEVYQTGTDMMRSSDGGATFQPMAVGGYSSLSGRVGYRFADHFGLAVSGTNLQQKSVQTSPYPEVERQLFLTLTANY